MPRLPDLCGSAARALGDYGVVRSAARLREVLRHGITPGDAWNKSEAAHALGDLLDEAAIPVLEETAATHPHEHVVDEAVSSLGMIGTLDAECALQRLLKCEKVVAREDSVLEAMLLCGSRSAVAIVLSRAQSSQVSPHWLCERLRDIDGSRGWRRGEYFTHVHTDELVNYLASNHHNVPPGQVWELGEAFRQIDSPAVRACSESGRSYGDQPRMHWSERTDDECCRTFALRDCGIGAMNLAIEYTLDQWGDREDNIYVSITADFLRPFPATAVAERLRCRLAIAATPSEIVRMLALLGRFGSNRRCRTCQSLPRPSRRLGGERGLRGDSQAERPDARAGTLDSDIKVHEQ